MVAALNVGSMRLSFLPTLRTNISKDKPTLYEFEDLYLQKGEEFGYFEMGSTIVILAQEGMMQLAVQRGSKVRYGQSVAKLL